MAESTRPVPREQIFFPEKGRTQQHFTDECNINILVDRWIKAGEAPFPPANQQYADFTNVSDFLTAQIQIKTAEAAFMALPTKVRSRFDNDPAELLAFALDPANIDEAIQLGLADPREPREEPCGS